MHSFHCLIGLAISHLYLQNLLLIDPLPGSGASLLLSFCLFPLGSLEVAKSKAARNASINGLVLEWPRILFVYFLVCFIFSFFCFGEGRT